MKQLVFGFLERLPVELRDRVVLEESTEGELLEVMAEAIAAVHTQRMEGSDDRSSSDEQDHLGAP